MIQVFLPGKENIINAYGATTVVYLLTGKDKMQAGKKSHAQRRKGQTQQIFWEWCFRSENKAVKQFHTCRRRKKSSKRAVRGCLQGREWAHVTQILTASVWEANRWNLSSTTVWLPNSWMVGSSCDCIQREEGREGGEERRGRGAQ